MDDVVPVVSLAGQTGRVMNTRLSLVRLYPNSLTLTTQKNVR
jgi:hypothetical protein